jgi:inosine/xanthosine triphosphatase
MQIHAAVGSRNPVKLGAAKRAFESAFPGTQVQVTGINCSSGVSHQPIGEEEIIKGARKRAQEALKKGKADYGVGLEGGIVKTREGYFNQAWACVTDGKKTGLGYSTGIEIPKKAMKKILEEGMELGTAVDSLVGTENIKQKQGFVGYATNNAVDREKALSHAVLYALARFLHPEVYE